MSHTIYLVEDEQDLNDLLTAYLKKEEWNVTSFYTGETARTHLSIPPDLWILDIMLPDSNGYELIKEIKEKTPHVPVIFISARDADLDRIVGLEMGSEDYLAKPFLPRELVIRTAKLLNRVYGKHEPSKIKLGEYEISEEKRSIHFQDTALDFSSKEFDLILLFAKHPNKVFSREELLTLIWGDDYFGSDRVVDDLVRRVRKKIPGVNLETVYGYGYRMAF